MAGVPWDPTGGRIAYTAWLIRDQASTLGPDVVFTREAAYDFALQAAFGAEKVALVAGWKGAGPREIGQAANDGAIARMIAPEPADGTGATFGDCVAVALDACKDVPAYGAIGSVSTVAKLGLAYLAVERTLRDLALSSRGTPDATPADVSVSVSLPGGDGLVLPPLPGLPGLGWAGVLILVGVLGSAAIAAYAWYSTATTVEQIKGNVALSTERVRLAAQAKLAADLAAQAYSAGQPVSIPDVVAAIGQREIASARYGWLIGGVAAVGLAGVGYGVYRWRKKRGLSAA